MDNEKKEDQPKVQADNNSIAVGGINIGGDISGNITIGHTGYTVEQVSVLLTQITSTFQLKPFDGRCPYKGLEVFEEEDAELFFGRERLVEDLVGRVKESRTVFITGPSGSGKSSLVRAGLIHALKQGAIKNLHSERWLYETMKPGREPIKDLALAFSRLKSPDLADYFQAHASEKDILNRCAESVLSGRKDQRFVLFIDQFEEVFTQINQEEERLTFLNMLAHAGTVGNGRVIILFAMRSDFLSNCATYPALNEMLSQQFRQIGAMQPEELVSAIALPAKHVGLPIEDELIAQIINDMKGEPGALPLMQFALKDLFDSQQEKGGVIALTLEDYLRHGGIHKSLERHADKSFATLSENEQKLARSIFSGLIEIGRGTQDTRRTALFDELVPANAKATEVQSVVQRLADARLIITDEQAGKDTVTISHEKLIDAWPWLKKLVNENRDVIALQNEIKSDAKEWDDHKRDPSYLYTGARLATAHEQLQAKNLVLSGSAYEFVRAGSAQQKRRQRTTWFGVAAIGVALTVAIAVFSLQSSNNAKIATTAQAASTEAVSQKATAQAASTIAVAQAEEAKIQTNIATARQLASQAQAMSNTSTSLGHVITLLAVQSMQMFPSSQAAEILSKLHPRSGNLTHDYRVFSVAFSLDGKYVVSGGDTTARVWEVATGNEVMRMAHNGDVTAVAFSPDGKYVVSGDGPISADASYEYTARVWEVATGNEVMRVTHNGTVTSVAFSPDGKYVISGDGQGLTTRGSLGTSGTTRVWDVATATEILHMSHNRAVTSVAFSPDGKYVVSGCLDGISRVWEFATGTEIVRLTEDTPTTSVAFSLDGKYVASGGYDAIVHVWEVATGNEVAHMRHDDLVTSVAFSPDGKYIVSGNWDYVARVWEVATGKEVTRRTHDDVVSSVAFSPDGKYVVSGSYDNTARVWIWQAEDLIANACTSGGKNLTRAEWQKYIGDTLPYQPICANLPFESESTNTSTATP